MDERLFFISYCLGFLATAAVIFQANRRKRVEPVWYLVAFILAIFWWIMVLDILNGEFD